jgi:two-component system OmpR family response regulator
MNILVVDDNESLTKLLQRYLKLKEYECTIANDGRTALSILNEKKFDSILLDLAMPEFSGIDFIKELTKKGKIAENKIVVLTASTITQKEEDDILNKGVRGLLRKPIKLESLMEILAN